MARNIVTQQIQSQLLIVGTGATPLSSSLGPESLIDSFVVSIPQAAANSVFIGDGGVTITNGIEILPGTALNLFITNERVLYELRNPLRTLIQCVTGWFTADPESDIPFVVFDPRTVYLVATAATNVSVMFFKAAYI